ncbi:MAG: 4'-phosphopantetheinyl transferase family protein, partial [Syntrophothermus sp.]
MIRIYYSYTNMLNEGIQSRIEAQLSEELKERLSSLKKESDRKLKILSLGLLQKALADSGHEDFSLNELKYDKWGRPFFAGAVFDFSISHTDGCAAVAFSENCRTGIDIERISEIDFSDFTAFFTPEQWDEIYSSENPLQSFYSSWTLIESCAKADGRGLPLLSSGKIVKAGGKMLIENGCWYYRHLLFDETISCCIASDSKDTDH